MSAPAGVEIIATLIGMRVRAGLTQQQMADRMGVTRPTVCRFESETMRRRTPSLDILQRYANVLGARITLEVDA